MGNFLYSNYHRHSNYSIITHGGDSVVKNEEYALRAVELGHKLISGVEHGFQGRHVEGYELAKKYNLKFLFGSEAYWVKDRFEKDRTNNHIVLLAKNEKGRKALNVALSEAFLTGYYYVPRLDLNLILNLPKDDIWVTSACIGAWKYDDSETAWLQMKEHFGKNFFLEVQNHNTDPQRELNKRILSLSKKYDIDIVFGADSHYIYPNQAKDRENYLLSKGIVYEGEEGWYMDYPDGQTAYNRFLSQGVLSEKEILDSIERTNLFLDVEEYNSPVYNKEIKMPTLYPDKNSDEKYQIFEKLIWNEWNKEKNKINPELWKKYEVEINKELDVIKAIDHADYFLLDHEIVKKGKEMGGVITSTGRGSGVSFYLCKLLGLTKIDRISSPVQLFPERFLSKERILETKSLADLDLNLANPEVFAQAQKELLGDDYSYPMIAWGTMRSKEAWKMYARANKVKFEIANDISSQIEEFEFAKKQADEDEDVFIEDYVNPKYIDLVNESMKYLGIYSNVKQHPCGYLIAPFNIREEAGLIAMKTSKGKVNICTLVDGLWAEEHKMLKNDLLKVSVVELYANTYKRIGMEETHDVNELWDLTRNDKSVWDIYKKGAVIGVNQFEQPSTAKKAMRYAPSNISEVSAFVAAIRPSFASMYNIFESRQPFSYKVGTFDNLIQTTEIKNSFIIYQEQIMATLSFAGIPISETYEVIKNIAKKRYEKVIAYKERFVDGFSRKLIENEVISEKNSIEISEKIWKILEDSAFYSFNSSHSICVSTDSLFVAYLKAHYPLYLYEQLLIILEKNGEKDRIIRARNEAEKFFNIKFPSLKFGQDNTRILASENKKEITMSMSILKGFGNTFASLMLELSQKFEGKGFLELLVFATENQLFMPSKFERLIMIDYFSDFGKGKKILSFFKEFTKGEFRYSATHKEKTKLERLENLKRIWKEIPNEDFSVSEKIKNEIDVLGEIKTKFPIEKGYFFVLDVFDESSGNEYSPKVTLHSLGTGNADVARVMKRDYVTPLQRGQIIYSKEFEKKPAVRKGREGESKFVEIEGQFNHWMGSSYRVVNPESIPVL